MMRGLEKLKDAGIGVFCQFTAKKITVLEKTRVVFSQGGIVIGQEAKDIICFRETPSGY